MIKKIQSIIIERPIIIFTILALSIYLDTSGFLILFLEFNLSKTDELLGYFTFIASLAIIATIIILLLIHRIVISSEIFPKEILKVNKIIYIGQTLILVFIVTILIQIIYQNQNNFILSVLAISLSLSIGLLFSLILMIKSLKWFIHTKGKIIFGYLITVIFILSFIICSILYFSYANYNALNLILEPMDIKQKVAQKNFELNKFQVAYDVIYLCLFLATWITIFALLINYLENKNRKYFIPLFCIPLIYSILEYYFNSYGLEFIISIIMLNNIYGTLYTVLFSGTIPLTGILFFIPLRIYASKIRNKEIKRFSIITSFGVLIFFTANQLPPLQEKFLPPFGVIASSFTGFSIYLIFLGIYSNVIYLSKSNTLKKIALERLYNDKFFRIIAKTEFERDLKPIIDKAVRDFEIEQPMELDKNTVDKLIQDIRNEIKQKRSKE